MLCFSYWKQFLIWLAVASGFTVVLPGILPDAARAFLPRWYAGLHVPMGLDLRGGTRLVAQVPQVPQDKAVLRDQVIEVIKQRLGQSGHGFQDYSINRHGRRQVCIEVPGFFDVQFLQDLVSVTARFTLYEEDGQAMAADVITGKAGLPEGARLIYSFDDPPVGYLVRSGALLTSGDIISADVTSSAEGHGLGRSPIDF
jgi:SecD/SecF fusion protein